MGSESKIEKVMEGPVMTGRFYKVNGSKDDDL
jgi:hypothetical protein